MRKPKIETDVRDLGWGSVESQQKRFDAIAGIGIKPTDSVLDVGCGYGDFCAHTTCKYIGIDVNKERIPIARKKYPSVQFEVLDIDNATIGYRADYIIASGIFWQRLFNPTNWITNVIDTINIMDLYARKGVAVNFLSAFARTKKPGRHYTTMAEIGEIMRSTSSRCTIRHDYLPNDMTLYIYKE